MIYWIALLIVLVHYIGIKNEACKFNPQDIWVGLFWKQIETYRGKNYKLYRVYICFIPCFSWKFHYARDKQVHGTWRQLRFPGWK